jgi:hypothetical protein
LKPFCKNCDPNCIPIPLECVYYSGSDVDLIGIKNGDSLSVVNNKILAFMAGDPAEAVSINASDVNATMPDVLANYSVDCVKYFIGKYITYEVSASSDGYLISYISDVKSGMPADYSLVDVSHVLRGSGQNTIIAKSDKLVDGFYVGGDKMPIWFEASYMIGSPCGTIYLNAEFLFASETNGKKYAKIDIGKIPVKKMSEYTQDDVNDAIGSMIALVQNKVDDYNITNVTSRISTLESYIKGVVSTYDKIIINNKDASVLFAELEQKRLDLEARLNAIQESLNRI